MGVGAYVSRIFTSNYIERFIEVELLLGFIGGISVPFLYFAFVQLDYTSFSWLIIFLIFVIGLLTGLEIPLLTKLLEKHFPSDVNLSNVLSLDYLGALAATLLFPFFLLPWVGVFLSSLLFGLVNVAVGIFNFWLFKDRINPKRKKGYYVVITLISLFFLTAIPLSSKLLAQWHNQLYRDRIVLSETTPYQTIVLTKANNDLRLYINRVIQFSTLDEYRYHESLIQIPMALAPFKKRVLILGGGEALAAREVLKHPDVEEVHIVDIDPAIFEIAVENRHLKRINQAALENPKVKPIPMDAMVYLKEAEELYDVIIADLPDPSNDNIARLYSNEFYKLVKSKLSPNGIFVTQATSVYHTNEAFWCINSTVKKAGFKNVKPYHAYVPSFGDWGFIMASNNEINVEEINLGNLKLKFLEQDKIPNLFSFNKDIVKTGIPSSSLDQPILLDLYLKGWQKWSREKVVF
ncbi:UNVERIFIED_CONTAM: hypothetical protein GTU68_023187 [Idotea baltica]|nr:hypothetical protein [Idotea baltica]